MRSDRKRAKRLLRQAAASRLRIGAFFDGWIADRVPEHAEFSEPARRLIEQATEGKYTLKVMPLILNEVCYVLTGKLFGLQKDRVSFVLKFFINLKGIECEEKAVIEATLDHFSLSRIDFADAYMTAHAKAVTPAHIVSHNVKDFLKLGIAVDTPEQLMNRHP